MDINTFIRAVNSVILNPLIILMFALSFLYFTYYAIRFLAVDVGDKGGARKEARDAMIWGIVGMVVMFSVYGLIGFVVDSIGVPPAGQEVREIIKY
mgnify:CR=1 FL=1